MEKGGINCVLTGPSGKKYGAAITAYKVPQGDFAVFNSKPHCEVNTTWTTSSPWRQ